jgi:hypothetical protein
MSAPKNDKLSHETREKVSAFKREMPTKAKTRFLHHLLDRLLMKLNERKSNENVTL